MDVARRGCAVGHDGEGGGGVVLRAGRNDVQCAHHGVGSVEQVDLARCCIVGSAGYGRGPKPDRVAGVEAVDRQGVGRRDRIGDIQDAGAVLEHDGAAGAGIELDFAVVQVERLRALNGLLVFQHRFRWSRAGDGPCLV